MNVEEEVKRLIYIEYKGRYYKILENGLVVEDHNDGITFRYVDKDIPVEDTASEIDNNSTANQLVDQIEQATCEQSSTPSVRKMDEWEWIIDNDYMYKNKPLKEKIIGTWFLCRQRNGELYITKDKPKKLDSAGAFMLQSPSSEWKSGWLALDLRGGSKFMPGDYEDLKREDFLCLNFPEVTYENSPLEIEIVPSGEVYFYV